MLRERWSACRIEFPCPTGELEPLDPLQPLNRRNRGRHLCSSMRGLVRTVDPHRIRSVDASIAAREWIDAWEQGWPARNAELIAEQYAPSAEHLSHPSRNLRRRWS